MRCIIFGVVAVLVSIGSAVAQEKIPDLVKRHGPIEKGIFIEYPPAELPEIAVASDFIARILVTSGRAQLTSNETQIETIDVAQVLSIIESDIRSVDEGGMIEIRKAGGTLFVEGREVRSVESDFPPLVEGVEYLVFLDFDRASRQFDFAMGGQSAFSVDKGIVRQLSKNFGTWNDTRGLVPTDAFVTEIRAARGSRAR